MNMVPGKPWLRPVKLALYGDGKYRTVANTREAVECLMKHWPGTRGQAYRVALQTCADVMDGRMGPDSARDAFRRAAEEAAIEVIQ